MNYEELHRSQSELEGADAELVTKMRECYSFLRSIEQAKINRMFFLTDTTKEERFFWATLNDIASYQRPWVEELKERNKRSKGMNDAYKFGDHRDFWRPDIRKETCLDCKHCGEAAPSKNKFRPRMYCLVTKRVGRELRGLRCLYFEKKEQASE